MLKNEHHFVPRSYLGAFQSAPRRINVLGVDASREIQDASLRNQCYRHKFVGLLVCFVSFRVVFSL